MTIIIAKVLLVLTGDMVAHDAYTLEGRKFLAVFALALACGLTAAFL